jgi:dATP pyrophosphohydrolase
MYRLGVVESFYTEVDDTLWHSVPFCAFVSRDQQVNLNEEHDQFRWVPRDQIESQTMWASERSLLHVLFRDILSGDSRAKPFLRIKP